MFEQAIVEQQCMNANKARRVEEGYVTAAAFFQKAKGDILISGKYGCDKRMLYEMIKEYKKDGSVPTIFLSSHEENFKMVQSCQDIISAGAETRIYHPLYDLSQQQINLIFGEAAEKWGYSSMKDKILLYVSAVLDVLELYYENSLPALGQLLQYEDAAIASLAFENGLPQETADDIKGNKKAGLAVRKIAERLFKTFEYVAEAETETNLCFSSIGKNRLFHMALYQYSEEQDIMNLCLREELKTALKHVKKIRIITDELLIESEEDPLLKWLKKMRQTGRVQWILCSENAGNLLAEKEMNFSNVCLFPHSVDAVTERISEHTFGRYEHHHAVRTIGQPPNLLFTLKRDEHWTTNRENRLRIRAEDLILYGGWLQNSTEKMAVKISQKDTVFLIAVSGFIKKKELPLLA